MTPTRRTEADRPVIAFGPEFPGIGSWEWIGVDLAEELSKYYRTVTFRDEIPDCDILVIVKYNLPTEVVIRATERASVVFCPVDYYGSSGEIDADSLMLCHCARIVIHTEQLRKYFQSYAPVEFLDHHTKFTAEIGEYQTAGHVLWVGMRTNLAPLADWVNEHGIPGELRILTNLEDGEAQTSPKDFGFRNPAGIEITKWTEELHREWTGTAKAAIDIKGSDFRQRHKPPAKAVDFVTSGVPLAMNCDSSPVEHLARMGFAVATPEDAERWLSREYWEETRRFGRSLRDSLSREQIGWRFKQIVDDVLAERRRR